MTLSTGERRARFRVLHESEQLFLLPNAWDVGSARLLASCGFEALATTSAGFAWSLGKLDQQVTRNELVAHVASLAASTQLPLNVDSERCYPDDPGGVAETVALLAEAGAAGFSIEDYDPATDGIDDVALAAERVAAAAEAAHRLPEPMVLTARAENHLNGVDDLDDTIARLVAYRDAGADAVYAPGLRKIDQIAAVVEAVRVPLNVLALPGGPTVSELAAVGVRRVSTGGSLAAAAYGALMSGARELQEDGTSRYAGSGVSRDALARRRPPGRVHAGAVRARRTRSPSTASRSTGSLLKTKRTWRSPCFRIGKAMRRSPTPVGRSRRSSTCSKRAAHRRPPAPTPLLAHAGLSELVGAETSVKHENHQPIGAFKVRGGVNLVSQLDPDERARRLIAASTGNHGQSVAYAARLFDARVTVCVPERANPAKLHSMRALGAEIVEHGSDFDEAREHCERLRRARLSLRPLRQRAPADRRRRDATLEILEEQPASTS